MLQNKKWPVKVRSELLHPIFGMSPLEVTHIPGLLLKSRMSHFWPERNSAAGKKWQIFMLLWCK